MVDVVSVYFTLKDIVVPPHKYPFCYLPCFPLKLQAEFKGINIQLDNFWLCQKFVERSNQVRLLRKCQAYYVIKLCTEIGLTIGQFNISPPLWMNGPGFDVTITTP
jgi:hypothetical protein